MVAFSKASHAVDVRPLHRGSKVPGIKITAHIGNVGRSMKIQVDLSLVCPKKVLPHNLLVSVQTSPGFRVLPKRINENKRPRNSAKFCPKIIREIKHHGSHTRWVGSLANSGWATLKRKRGSKISKFPAPERRPHLRCLRNR